jgi:myosin heavy subunit
MQCFVPICRFGKLICIQYRKSDTQQQQSRNQRARTLSTGQRRRSAVGNANDDDDVHISRGIELAGARIINYLLERSRTVHASPSERSFHIFYQLLSSAVPEALRRQLKLDNVTAKSFQYLSKSGCVKVDGVDDALAFGETIEAMQAIGLSEEQTKQVWAVVAAILHLGNVAFVPAPGSDEASQVQPSTEVWLTNCCVLLQCDPNILRNALTTKRMNVPASTRSKVAKSGSSTNTIESPVNATQAAEARDAVAKTMYFRLFSWLVARINDTTDATRQHPSNGEDNDIAAAASSPKLVGCVSILDIYGFEDLSSNQISGAPSTNSFSQLLINNANERLQSMFNHAVFVREARVYQEEGIQWNPTDFPNNQPCLDLIDARTNSIFALLDEECLRKGAGNDMAFCRKITAQFGTHAFFGKCGPTTAWRKPNGTRTTEQEFVIRHFADNVIYTCESFVAQNQDTFQTALSDALGSSGLTLVKELFSSGATTAMRYVLLLLSILWWSHSFVLFVGGHVMLLCCCDVVHCKHIMSCH